MGVRAADHMKLSRGHDQPLGEAVRDAVGAATGWRPSARCAVQMLTSPAILGYNFNPVSFYYVWNEAGDAVDTVIAEVTNTPWGEMHYYVLRAGAPGVLAVSEWEGSGGSGAEGAARQRVGAESSAAAAALAASGAVAPADFEALAAQFEPGDKVAGAPAGAAPSVAARAAPSASAGAAPAPPRRLRFRFQKTFHVSPFMPVQDQSYDWIFSQPALSLGDARGEALVVQSQNLQRAAGSAGAGGGAAPARMLYTQLRLARQPLTPFALAYLVLVAFPLLTFRVQWWIHVEAVRLWLKGVALFPHPTGASNAVVRTFEAVFAAVLWLTNAWAAMCSRRAQGVTLTPVPARRARRGGTGKG